MENGMANQKYNRHKIEQEITKSKRAKHSDNHAVFLHLKISHVEGMDKPIPYPSAVNEAYGATVWVKPGEEIDTEIVNCSINPVWREECIFFLGEDLSNYMFLNVEVLRFKCVNDPGTSSGRVLVGTAMIPLPTEFNQTKVGRFGLVWVDHEGGEYKAEGQIILSMELKRCSIA